MARQPKQFQAFDSLMGDLLAVPKSTIHARHKAHKEKAALNPKKRGPKRKVKPSASGDPDAGMGG